MKLYSLFMFIFVFTIDVRVRALDVESKSIIEDPEHCLKAQGYCVIKNLNKKFSYKGEQYVISMSPESILIRQKAKELSFVKGQLFVKTQKEVVLDIPYGQIEIAKNTQVLLEKTDGKVLVQTIFGKVFLRPLGQKKPVLVMQGHENYLSEVNESHKAQTGIPKPILIESLLKNWAYHSTLKKNEFLEDVRNFKEIHQEAIKELSILNEQIASREIASAKAEKSSKELRAKRSKEQKEKLQKSYYNRLLGE